MALIIHVEHSTDGTDIAVRKGEDWQALSTTFVV
jgi:hypothetical protein